jgi:hypothetical protein
MPYLKSLILILLTSVCLIGTGYAAERDVTLQWDKSIDDPYLQSYKVYYYTIPGDPGSLDPADYAASCTVSIGSCQFAQGPQGPITIDKANTQLTLRFTDISGNYYFAVTAVDTRGLEGVPTPEISLLIKMTVSKAGSTGTGIVTSQPLGINSDINCGSTTCSADYINGSQVTLTATPDAGNAFTGWSGSGCTGTGQCVVTMDMAKDVTATFRPLRKLVSPNAVTGLNFGYVEPGQFKDLTLTVQNIGTQLLTGTVSAPPPFSIVSGGSYSLGDSQSQQVVVRYTAPLQEGLQTGSLIFTGGGGLTIRVRGTNRVGLPWLMLLLN